jgi:hypothetical protein
LQSSPQQAQQIDLEHLVSLRGKIAVTADHDVGVATVTLGNHPVAGLVVLISTPEASSCIVIAQDLQALHS